MAKARTSLWNLVRSQPWVRNPYVWCIAIRFLMQWLVPRHLQGDAGDYEQIAINLSQGKGFTRCFFEPYNPTMQRPPLYPLVLGFLYLVGVSSEIGPIALNTACDLVSMRLARTWCQDLRLSWARHAPW